MKSISVRVSMALVFVLMQGIFSPLWSDPLTVVLPQFRSTGTAEYARSRMSLLTDRSFANMQIREVGRSPEGAVLVELVVTLENVGVSLQPDHAAPELVLYLPAGVQVAPGTVSATSGAVTVTGSGQGTTLEWNGELAGGDTTSSTTTVVTQVTVQDLPINGMMIAIDSEGDSPQ